MNKKARNVFTVLVLAAVCPVTAFGETPRGAGIVTTLQGQATVTRAIGSQQPMPMKFRDEVYYKDQISVKEHSLARVLLGGKALVTVRELSELTVTELPNRPTVLDMLSGKISLAVAKMRMLPGEAIEVRTPNAVAAIRGTTLVVEVIPTSESIRSGKASDVVTNVHVLTGKVDVFSPGSPKQMVSVGPGFSVSVTGAVLGQLRPTPPSVQFTHGHMPQVAHQQAPDEVRKDMAAKQMAKAMATAESVLPSDSDSTRVEGDGRKDGNGPDGKAKNVDNGRLALAVAPVVAGATTSTIESTTTGISITGSSGGSLSTGGSSSGSGSYSSGGNSGSGSYSSGGGLSSGSGSGGLASILGSLLNGEKGKRSTGR